MIRLDILSGGDVGHPPLVSATDVNGSITQFGYNVTFGADGSVTGVDVGSAQAVNWASDPNGQVANAVYNMVAAQQYTHDPIWQLSWMLSAPFTDFQEDCAYATYAGAGTAVVTFPPLAEAIGIGGSSVGAYAAWGLGTGTAYAGYGCM